jgi:hypothetical protein
MTTIKASCPICGDVELSPSDVRLMLCSEPGRSYYAFTCAGCTDEVRKPADDRIASLLMSGGVAATVWEIPAEALEPKYGPALTYDDLLDMLIGLQSDDLLAARAAEYARR